MKKYYGIRGDLRSRHNFELHRYVSEQVMPKQPINKADNKLTSAPSLASPSFSKTKDMVSTSHPHGKILNMGSNPHKGDKNEP